MGGAPVPEASERVLSTLNRDGSRRWIEPRIFRGRFWYRRLAVAWVLILVFTAIPYLRMNGKPLMRFDLPRREFTLFGATFLPTDTALFMLLMVGILLTIFVLTALFGRVWCGWACPQTVYMEFVYRPLERWLDDRRARGFTARLGPGGRRALKYLIYALVSIYLAHTFLAYFVGVEALSHWVRQSPFTHPAAFLVMAITATLMLLDFAWFREQVCIVACPYGRFQSVLLDRRSLIVGYDARRGEPRGKPGRLTRGEGTGGRGDCIDCGACVITCPTGIDIRDGLQMECVGCTQCIDACDSIMDRIGKPRGLIRYTSREILETGRRKLLRPRVVVYPLLLLAAFGLLGFALAERAPADVTVLRGLGSPFVQLPSGEISNQIRVKIVNRTDGPRRYLVEIAEPAGFALVAPENPVPLEPGAGATATVFVTAPAAAFRGGESRVLLRVGDGEGFAVEIPYRLLGPETSNAEERP